MAGSAAPRLGVRRLLDAHGLVPDTALGQHFLVDENFVDVAIRESALGPDDVVLEIGAGVGVLTVALARIAKHVHAIEFDRRLEPALRDALGGDIARVDLRLEDAMKTDLEGLSPPPTRMIANLPYSIATPIVAESTWRLPGIERWTVMVQREVADRWLAMPGGRLYGAPTVLLRLAAEPVHRRPVGPDAFVPKPRVESSLLTLRRTGPGADAATRALVRAAFGARRKTLANALAAGGYSKPHVERALEGLGVERGARPEQLTPEQFAALADRLAGPEGGGSPEPS